MKQIHIAFIVGFIFAIGLGVAGMTQPQNVIGFLDLGAWNPSLLFVMVGAIGVHALLYPLIRKRPSPLLDMEWHVPKKSDLSPSLVLGSAIFGIGWGLGGFCPGPAIVSVATFQPQPIVFVFSMLAGMFVFRKVEPLVQSARETQNRP